MFGHIFGEASDVVTGVLGIDADTLRTELQDGKSLADIATEHDVDPQAVIDTLVAEATTQIDQAVTDGRVEADRADELKADLEDHITDLVNGEFPGPLPTSPAITIVPTTMRTTMPTTTAPTPPPPPTRRPPRTPPPPPATDPLPSRPHR